MALKNQDFSIIILNIRTNTIILIITDIAMVMAVTIRKMKKVDFADWAIMFTFWFNLVAD
jgi:hypothetical protein